MAVQPIIKNGQFTGSPDTGPLPIAQGTVRTQFWVNVDDVQPGTGYHYGYIWYAADGQNFGTQPITKITVEAPPADAKSTKSIAYYSGMYYQTVGAFKITANLPSVVTLDASAETFTS